MRVSKYFVRLGKNIDFAVGDTYVFSYGGFIWWSVTLILEKMWCHIMVAPPLQKWYIHGSQKIATFFTGLWKWKKYIPLVHQFGIYITLKKIILLSYNGSRLPNDYKYRYSIKVSTCGFGLLSYFCQEVVLLHVNYWCLMGKGYVSEKISFLYWTCGFTVQSESHLVKRVFVMSVKGQKIDGVRWRCGLLIRDLF